jgi:hypothetical protein
MITEDTLRKCAYLSTSQVEKILNKFYPDDRIIMSTFLGINNSGQFCYSITYYDTIEGKNLQSMVFVYRDKSGEIFADY